MEIHFLYLPVCRLPKLLRTERKYSMEEPTYLDIKCILHK